MDRRVPTAGEGDEIAIDTPRAAAGLRHDVDRVDTQPAVRADDDRLRDDRQAGVASRERQCAFERRARPGVDDRRYVDPCALQRQRRRVRAVVVREHDGA